MSDMELDLQLVDATFSSVDEERAHVREGYRQRLAEKLKDPKFRNIEGFPIGSDEAILTMSDPPYYTACPNPFMAEWVHEHAKPYDPTDDTYHREPFASDVSEGKTDPIYNAHGYHTKVPYKAIMRYILHYTEPGDIVFDGFCGSGMTGVAAQICADPDPEYKRKIEDERTSAGLSAPAWGVRNVILNDLSPAATFIAANYNLTFDATGFSKEGKRILDELWNEIGWMYETCHEKTSAIARINYTVWSEVFTCPNCALDVVFMDQAYDQTTGRVRESFPCQHCMTELTKDSLEKNFDTLIDPVMDMPWRRIRLVPILINYSIGKSIYEKRPSKDDITIIEQISSLSLPGSLPKDALPIEKMGHGSRLAPKGFRFVRQLFLPRAGQALGKIWDKANAIRSVDTKRSLLFAIEQAIWGMSLMNRYQPIQQGRLGGSQVNRQLSGVYYIASQHAEVSPWYNLNGKLRRIVKAFNDFTTQAGVAIISTGTAATTPIAPDSVDYIFTDPPFGENIPYADLNFIVESWHGVITNTTPEATVDRVKGKGLPEYLSLMRNCFAEYFRVLKPGRWMTVVFHNSHNAVWNVLQEAIQAPGFVVCDVRVLDKQQGSFRQVTTTTTMKQDLVVSCYKPRKDFEDRFGRVKGDTEGAIEFVRSHLAMLPVVAGGNAAKIETVVERTQQRLFDRMVAYHLVRGARIPMSATEFYAMLDEEFIERDEMYFLPDQAVRYDSVRSRAEVEQPPIFVNDERSAVQWVRVQLQQHPLTLGELTTPFLQEVQNWDSREPVPELRYLLRENFIKDDNTDRWRVPDPTQEKDLEAMRRTAMLKTFEGYVKTNSHLKVFRKEAILEGFKHCWQTKQYGVIVAVCERIPAKILQEVPEFVQFYDIAKGLAPAETQQLEFTWEG